MHYDEPVFVDAVGIAVGDGVVVATAGVAVAVIVVGVAVVVFMVDVVEGDDEADTLWSVNCQSPSVMTPIARAATRRSQYFCVVRFCATLRPITGVPRGGRPPDSIVMFPCGHAIQPRTVPLLSSVVVRNLVPGLRTCPCRTWSWQVPHVPERQPNSG